jgi:predicted transglutaminase-like cysteine proteinase
MSGLAGCCRGWWPRLLAGALFGALVLLPAPAAEARSYPALFGAKEIGSTNWGFKKGVVPDWRQMLGRWKGGSPCESKICTSKSWAALVSQVKSAGDPKAQIDKANALMNDARLHPYIEDINNWGKSEFWATSYEFLKKSGDCEDYSIAKYMLLKEAGMPVENMRIFSVRVRSLGGIGHAILVVYQGNTAWVLDNRTNSVLDASRIKVEFQPVMSLNENQWWYHLPSK